MKELLINEQIRDREIRVIGEDGNQYGILSLKDALALAEEKGLDLCKVTPPNVQPATCKLMDYGKYRYDQIKREKEASKNQKVMEIKEIRLSAVIDIGDITRLAKQTAKFIEAGNKVKSSIKLKGRQQAHPEIAVDIVNQYIDLVKAEVDVQIEKAPAQDGRMIFAMLAPVTKKN